MCTPSAPAAPDPYKTASAQTGSNIGTAIAQAAIGNSNTVGPTGSTSNAVTGSTSWTDPTSGQTYQLPQYTTTTTLSPEQQKLYDQQTQLGSGLNQLAIDQTGKISGLLSSPLDTSTLPSAGTLPTNTPSFSQAQTSIGPTDYSADRQKVEDALYSRLNPQLDRDRASLENTLVNQGLVRGTDAFNQAMDSFNRQANDQRTQVVLAGGQEQSRLADLALQQGQFQQAGTAQNNASAQQGYQNQVGLAQDQTTARQNALQEQLALRNQPINEISSLMSGGQVTMPQFQGYNAPTVAGTDVAGAVYKSNAIEQQQYQAAQQRQSQILGGLLGLGAAGVYGSAAGGAGGVASTIKVGNQYFPAFT
jgi:hypothetical protein